MLHVGIDRAAVTFFWSKRDTCHNVPTCYPTATNAEWGEYVRCVVFGGFPRASVVPHVWEYKLSRSKDGDRVFRTFEQGETVLFVFSGVYQLLPSRPYVVVTAFLDHSGLARSWIYQLGKVVNGA